MARKRYADPRLPRNRSSIFDQLYCQNLTLFGKLFIDHKTLYFDIDRCRCFPTFLRRQLNLFSQSCSTVLRMQTRRVEIL